jgi:hypothetical protein
MCTVTVKGLLNWRKVESTFSKSPESDVLPSVVQCYLKLGEMSLDDMDQSLAPNLVTWLRGASPPAMYHLNVKTVRSHLTKANVHNTP